MNFDLKNTYLCEAFSLALNYQVMAINNSSLEVCLPTTDVLSINIQGTGVSDGSGTTVHTLPNPNPIERIFKVYATCQVQITLSSQSKNIVLESLELLRLNSTNLGYEDDNEEYRYGFNGQQKQDELYGKGNKNTALYWELKKIKYFRIIS